MFKSPFSNPLPSKRLFSAAAPAMTVAAVLAVMVFPMAMTNNARASDLDITQPADDGNFLRIGIGKSAVIKLPAAAKDVIVGDPSVVDVVLRNRNTAYFFARQPGQTNVFFFDAEGNEILNLDLEASVDSKAIKKLIDRTVPGNAIQVDSTGKSIVLKGTAANAQEAKLAEDLVTRSINQLQCDCQVVNAMSIAEGDQVMLKVRVVEVKRDVVKRLGINLRGILNVGNLTGSLTAVNPIAGALVRGTASYAGDDGQIDANIQAMESEGVLRTLAEPTLTAVSGQPAMFHAGGEFEEGTTCSGSSGSSNNGNGSFSGGSCTTSYKKYGVTLGFTPVVMNEGRISLKIATSISEPDAANSTSNSRALTTRSTETTVELPSGGSMMLAGLIKDSSTQSINGTPGLKDLPVLGALFRSRDFVNQQTEMVVIVTPYIVNPVATKELATPADRLGTPTDRQSILFGRLSKIYGTPGQHPNGVYHGTVGYIIE